MQARSPLKQQTKVDASFARSVCCCRYLSLLFSVFVIAGVVVAVAFVGIIATIATRIVLVGVFSVGRLCTYHPLQPSRNLPSPGEKWPESTFPDAPRNPFISEHTQNESLPAY